MKFQIMKRTKRLSFLTLRLTVASMLVYASQVRAQNSPWSLDVSLYGLGAGMSGNATVKGINTDVDVGFDKVLDHLQFGAMGSVRIGYDRWALRTEVIYMALGASKGSAKADVDQWLVEPTLSYRFCDYFEALAGARYNNLSAELSGVGPLGNFRVSSGTVDWWDPIIGGIVHLPLGKGFSVNVRGDVGGFNLGSELTWQAFPYVSWQFTKWGSLEAGYRWLYVNYSQGSGASQFRYDILTQGPQVGFTLHF
jgi:hypothetical protein